MARVMSQQDVEQWIADHGGADSVQYSETTENIPNPAGIMILPDGSMNPQYTPTAQPYIQEQRQTWINSKTKAKLAVRPSGDGQFEVKDDIGPDPNKDTQRPKPPPNGELYAPVNTPNGKFWGVWNPEAERYDAMTDNPYHGEASKPPLAQGADGRTYSITVSADGKVTATAVEGIPAKSDVAPRIVVKGADGKQYVVTVGADGQGTASPIEGLPAERDQYTNQTTGIRYERGDDGIYRPVKVEGDKEGLPSGAPRYTPDWTKGDFGLQDYARAIREAPGLTQAQRTALVDDAYKSATSTAQQASTIATASQNRYSNDVSQRGQDVSMANQRLSTGSNMWDNAVKATLDLTKYGDPNSNASAGVLPFLLSQGRQQVQSMGGLVTPMPAIPGASIQQLSNKGIPGLATNQVLPVVAGYGMGPPSVPGLVEGVPVPQGAAAPPVMMPNDPKQDWGVAPPPDTAPAAIPAMAGYGQPMDPTDQMLIAAGFDPAAVRMAREGIGA